MSLTCLIKCVRLRVFLLLLLLLLLQKCGSERPCGVPFKRYLPYLLNNISFHHISPHSTTLFTLFIFFKNIYQIIHFLYHIIYYSNKKSITKQIFLFFNTTFSFVISIIYYYYYFLICEQCIVENLRECVGV